MHTVCHVLRSKMMTIACIKNEIIANTLGKPHARWFLLVLLGSLMGCNSVSTRFVTGLSVEERALAAKLPVYHEKLPEGSYELVGPVIGFSCRKAVDDSYRPSEENAMEELKSATVIKAGRNAVMEVRCEFFVQGQGTMRCFRSFECRGNAVQVSNVY